MSYDIITFSRPGHGYKYIWSCLIEMRSRFNFFLLSWIELTLLCYRIWLRISESKLFHPFWLSFSKSAISSLKLFAKMNSWYFPGLFYRLVTNYTPIQKISDQSLKTDILTPVFTTESSIDTDFLLSMILYFPRLFNWTLIWNIYEILSYSAAKERLYYCLIHFICSYCFK